MHEKHARWLAAGIGTVVFAAALGFAARGPGPVRAAARPDHPTSPIAPASAPRGATLFVELGCAECHSFRGVGDPSGALDDATVGRDPRELERWIVAAPEVAAELSRKARKAKAPYAALPREDLDALTAYLSAPAPR